MNKWIKRIGYSLITLVIILIGCLDTLEKTSYKESVFYRKTLSEIEKIAVPPTEEKPVLVGWKRMNIIPSFPVKMAGYGNRGYYTSIHDSLFVRTFLFKQEQNMYAIVSFDLIMIHTDLKNAILNKIKEISSFENLQVYFSATHTHSSLGGWSKGLLAKFTLGGYDQKMVDFLVNQTILSLQKSYDNLEVVKIGYTEANADDYVKSRVLDKPYTYVDGLLRATLFKTPTKSALLTTFSAHPTNLNIHSKEVSADYPAYLTKRLEQKVDFSMFCAGAVGSQKVEKHLDQEHSKIQKYGEELAEKIIHNLDTNITELTSVFYQKTPIKVREPHFRVHSKIRLRPWLFNLLYKYEGLDITTLKLNNITFLGTPCDFSGELYQNIEQERKGKNPMVITSFNGNYIGYVNNSDHYWLDDNEINQMTWLGEDNGDYFVEIMTKIIDKLN